MTSKDLSTIAVESKTEPTRLGNTICYSPVFVIINSQSLELSKIGEHNGRQGGDLIIVYVTSLRKEKK